MLDVSLQLGWGAVSGGYAGHDEFEIFEGVRLDLLV